MRSALVIAVVTAAFLASPPPALGKEDYAVRVCGSSGCEVVGDPVVEAAIFGEAERYGAVADDRFVRSYYQGAYFTVRLVAPDGDAFGKEYDVPVARIRETQASSDPEVAEPLEQATSGIEPYSVAGEEEASVWPWIAGVAGMVAAGTVALRRARRRLRAHGASRSRIQPPDDRV